MEKCFCVQIVLQCFLLQGNLLQGYLYVTFGIILAMKNSFCKASFARLLLQGSFCKAPFARLPFARLLLQGSFCKAPFARLPLATFCKAPFAMLPFARQAFMAKSCKVNSCMYMIHCASCLCINSFCAYSANVNFDKILIS